MSKNILHLAAVAIATVSAFPDAEYDSEFEELKEFVRSHGGHVSEEIERSTGPDPDNKLRGLYAKVDFKAGDEFVRAPFPALILGENHCDAVKNLADELRMGEDAPHYPYIKSFEGHDLMMPNLWSTNEQQLLTGITPHDPNRHTVYFEYHCANREKTGYMTLDDPIVKRAFFLVVARTSTCTGKVCLVPIYDMANHIHKERLNTKWQIEVDGDNATAVMSIRHDIPAGTQIHSFYSANTPGMLREYGFVDSWPREWWYLNTEFQDDHKVKDDHKAHRFKVYEDGRIVVKNFQAGMLEDARDTLIKSLRFEHDDKTFLQAKRFLWLYQQQQNGTDISGWITCSEPGFKNTSTHDYMGSQIEFYEACDGIPTEYTQEVVFQGMKFTPGHVQLAVNYRREFNNGLQHLLAQESVQDAEIGDFVYLVGDDALGGAEGVLEEISDEESAFVTLPQLTNRQLQFCFDNGIRIRDAKGLRVNEKNKDDVTWPFSILVLRISMTRSVAAEGDTSHPVEGMGLTAEDLKLRGIIPNKLPVSDLHMLSSM